VAVVERWTALVTRVLAPNAGPMTLEGTNSLIVQASPGGAVAVIDPGPDDATHLAALRAAGPVELIVLTHHHRDHTEAAASLAKLTGAPVRACDAGLCIGAPALRDGETLVAGGTRIDVVFTPGHTADSVSLHLPDDVPLVPDRATTSPTGGSMITGDTILGRGTTIIAQPDGSLASYLASLGRLATYGAIPVLPAHGPMLPSLAEVCRTYAAHRRVRLDQLRAVLEDLGEAPSEAPDVLTAVVDTVYRDIDPAVRFAAEATVRAQLQYLLAEGSSGSHG